MTKPKPKKAVRREVRIKAFAVINGNGEAIFTIAHKMAYIGLSRTSLLRKKIFYNASETIIPCVITYSLPRLTKKR